MRIPDLVGEMKISGQSRSSLSGDNATGSSLRRVRKSCKGRAVLPGMLVAIFVADLVRGVTAMRNIGSPNLLANIARYAVMGFAVLVALEQLQIAPGLINILFTAVIGAVALAFGLAFGLGGRETASRWLSRTENLMGRGPQTPRSIPTYKPPVPESQATVRE